MAGFIRVPADDAGKRVDTVTLTDELVEVHRQKMVVTGGSGTAEVVVVTNAAPAGTDMGLVVRQAGTATVTGAVSITGGVAISGTATVAGIVSLAAGTSNIGFINNISATVTVAGAVSLAAGTSNIGTINNISAAVVLAAGSNNIGTVNNISAAIVLAAGSNNIGFINNISANVSVNPVNISNTPSVILAAGVNNFGTLNGISATVTVAGVVGLTAGTANIGSINNISATVTVAVRSRYTNLSVQSASRGPRMVLASTSSNVTLVAAPGAGMAVYVTSVAVSNASGSNTRGRIGTSASIGTITMMLAASGGGFVMQLEPPWKLSANEALLCSVKPNASEGIFNCNFFVASADAL